MIDRIHTGQRGSTSRSQDECSLEVKGVFLKDGFTRLALILDRSGSMASIEEATIAGVNKFIEEQKQVPGTATLKLVQFDDVDEEVFDTLIAEAPELTLSKTPRRTEDLRAQGLHGSA